MVFGQVTRTVARRFSTSAVRRSTPPYNEANLNPPKVWPFYVGKNPYRMTFWYTVFCSTGMILPTVQVYIFMKNDS